MVLKLTPSLEGTTVQGIDMKCFLIGFSVMCFCHFTFWHFRRFKISSIFFRRFKSKRPQFKGQMVASEKSRGTAKTLKHHITVINVYSSIFKIARYLIIITRYLKILLYFNVIYRRSMVHL